MWLKFDTAKPASLTALLLFLFVMSGCLPVANGQQVVQTPTPPASGASPTPGTPKIAITNTGVIPPRTPGGMSSRSPNMLTSAEAMAELRGERDAYFVNAQKELYKSTLEVLAQHQAELNRGVRFSKLMRGDPAYKEIALTFDDGPHAGYTEQILTILKKYHVPATFFVVGMQAEKFPELIKEEEKDGHLIANHTYHHVSLPKIPEEYVADEIMACGKVIGAITGKVTRYFRPPGGEYDKEVAEASDALGYTMVLWTDDPGDYASPGADVILKRTLDRTRPGGIILLHDGIAQTVQILPRLLETLKSQGYKFVRVDRMHRPKDTSVASDITARLKPIKQKE